MSDWYRRSTVLAGFLLLPLAACAPDAEQEENPPPAAQELGAPTEQPPEDLIRIGDEYVAAWNGEDAAAVSAFFMEDAVVRVGDETYSGRQEIETRWVLPSLPAISDLEITETNTERRGDEWYRAGTYRHQVIEEGAEPFTATGRYLTIWARTPDGQWRIRTEEVTADASPQG
ncbi:MAG TPA: nuclear transport factor 2 family protein [Longimicrobiales bacterium]|nr:nuclear transport factor 2 family protein [Longimicrobiales bacterium]